MHISPEGLGIDLAHGRVVWPWHEITQTKGFHAGEPVRLDRGSECIVIADRQFLMAAGQYAPHLHRGPADERAIRTVVILAAVCVLALASLIVAFIYGVPIVAAYAVRAVPVGIEETMGRAAASQLAPASSRCTDPQLTSAVNHIRDRLLTGVADNPYTFQVVVADAPEVNALAAPGGQIVIYRGLLRQASTPEELAGVLAHEMQHVIQRHSTKGLLRQAGIATLLSLIVGDTGAWIALASQLGNLSFQREDEFNADRLGLATLRAARVDARGMVRMYSKLSAEAADVPVPLQYLSTHPRMEARLRTIASAAESARYPAPPIEVGGDWKLLTQRCR